MKGIETMLAELVEAEKTQERTIPMLPLFDLFEKVDYRYFLSVSRDYIYFDDVSYLVS